MADTLTERLTQVAAQLEGVNVPEIAALIREAVQEIARLHALLRTR